MGTSQKLSAPQANKTSYLPKKKRKMSYRRTIRMTAAPPLAGGALKLQGDDIHGYHSIQIEEEQVAFAGWMNRLLKDDKDVAHLLPIAEDGCDMYGKIDDGIILCKVVNFACPGTIVSAQEGQ